MANTKKTPRKQGKIKCHVCFVEFDTEEAWEAHIVQCAKTKRDSLVYSCSAAGCTYLSQRCSDYNRHCRRKHGLVDIDSDSDWEKCKPGTLSDIIGDPTSTEGNEISGIKKKTPSTTKGSCCVRKATTPAPVSAPTKKRLLETLAKCIQPVKVIPRTTATATESSGTPSQASNRSDPLFSDDSMEILPVFTTAGSSEPRVSTAIREHISSVLQLHHVHRYK